MKIKVSQAQSNWFVFKEAPGIKEGCADLHNPDMNRVKWVQTATHGDAIRVLSFLYLSLVKMIPETELFYLMN